jgi:hypothetical protein
MSIFTLFSLAGGLGLFLYGMSLMSDGLTNVAGAKLRSPSLEVSTMFLWKFIYTHTLSLCRIYATFFI